MQTIPVLGSVLLAPSEVDEPSPPVTFGLEWDPATDRLQLDPVGTALLGLGEGSASETRQRYLERIQPADREVLAEAVASLSPSCPTCRVRYRLQAGDGELRLLEEHALARLSPSGALVGLTSVVADVSALASRDRLLRAKEEALNFWLDHQLGIMDRIPAMIMLYDPSLTLVKVNRELERVLGWSTRDLESVDMLEAWYPRPEQRARARDSFTTSESGWRDLMTTAKDGTEIDVSWATVALTPERRLAVGIDVRDRKRAVRAMRESEERLRSNLAELEGIYDNAPVALCVLDHDLRFKRANAQLAEINAMPVSQHIGRTVYEVAPDLALQAETFARQVYEKGEPVIDAELTGEIPNRPGEQRVWLESWWPIKNAEGAVTAINIAAREVTEERRTERRLAESEARFRNMAETVPDILYTADSDGRVDYVNRRFYRLTGRPESSGLGTGWLEAVHPEDRERVADAWRAAVQQSAQLNLKYRLCCADGVDRWFETRARPVVDPTLGEVKWYGAASDVDELVRMHQALEAADRQKNEFLAILGHELRNPMAPVRSAVDLMEAIAPADAQLRWAIGIVDRQSMHLSRLVDDLLDVSRIARGKLKLHKRLCSLQEIVAQVVDGARPLMDERGHRLDVCLPETSLHIDADPARMIQVLVNLLNNAAKYTPESGYVQLIGEAQAQTVVIRVIDNGEGIDPELRAGLFDAFTQGRRRLDRAPGGLGLGLAIAARLTELHGGRIEAHSEGPGQGAEFRVILPLAQSQVGPEEQAEPSGSASDARVRILVVDDNEDVATSMAALLNALGHTTVAVFSGADAIERVGSFQPRIVLLDIGMEGMDGLETARRLRSMEPDPSKLLLVAVSGYGDTSFQTRGREAGFDLHLTKPVGRRTLVEVLESVGREEASRV